MNTTDNMKWNVAILNIDWRADRHDESHCIEFEVPTADNPTPEHPVVKGDILSTARLPMSSEWGPLFASVKVETFDDESLTVQYGKTTRTVRVGQPWVKLGEGGMNYTNFWLFLGVKYVQPKSQPLIVTHDEGFLRRFRQKERIMRLTDADVQLLREQADKGDAYAQYGLGRWLYYNQPIDTAMCEAEQLFLSSMKSVPDAMTAYALMWRYGDTKENRMDLEKSNQLLQTALEQGSVRAAIQMARYRIFGIFCDAEPEAVAKEIEERMEKEGDFDPEWHTLLGYAYEETDRQDDAVDQYEQAVARGDMNSLFYMASIYYQRGNMALYESLMMKGILRGSALCHIYQADMDEEDYQKLSAHEKREMHDRLQADLESGLKMGDGLCAYYLWCNTYNKTLGFSGDEEKWASYLKQGARLGEVNCIMMIAELAEDGEWPESLSKHDIYELWLKAARYSYKQKEAICKLKGCYDTAFLLQHKEELEKYWLPLWHQLYQDAPEPQPARAPKTPIDPMVIVIWPTGHLDVEKADVHQMTSYREMGQALIGADGLDAVRHTPMLHTIGEAAELDQPLVMYVDRDAQTKDLPDNAIGTLLYGGTEVRGPIIVCLQDQRGDCMSFTTLEDLTATYNEINNHSGGLLIIKDEDDGRYDAWA